MSIFKNPTSVLCILTAAILVSSCGGGDSVPTPDNPVVLNTTASGFSFSWNDNGVPLLIQLSEQEDFGLIAFEELFESSPSEMSGLKSGTTYFLRAQHPSASTPFSSTQQVATNALTSPTGFTISEIFGDSFTVSWAAVAGASYAIDVSLDNAFTSILDDYNGLSIDDSQITVFVPQVETTYFFRLKSVNGAESSDYSQTGMATTDSRLIFRFTSDAFQDGGKIPLKYSCQGPSTPLSWRTPPQGTQSYALIMKDLDFRNGYNHWVIFNMDPSSRGLIEGASAGTKPPGSIQGTNDLGRVGYFGPCPPAGESHRYEYILYALDAVLNLDSSATETSLLAAMNGHILAQKTLTGLFN